MKLQKCDLHDRNLRGASCSCVPSSNQYLSIRKKHLATLREIARDGTVEVGQFKAALQWAISRLDGMPEHWVASPDETTSRHPESICTVINNNQPGWTNIVETAPNVTLPVGTKLYDESALISVGCGVIAGPPMP